MMARYKKYVIFIAFIICIQSSVVYCNTPADHLVPPPLPYNQRLPQRQAQDESGVMATIAKWFGFGEYDDSLENQIQPLATYQVPVYKLPPPYASVQQFNGNLVQLQHYKIPTQKTSLPGDPTTQTPQPYHYNAPKEPCNSCNKAPWIPVYGYPGVVQQPQQQASPATIKDSVHQQSQQVTSNLPTLPPPPQYAPSYHFIPQNFVHKYINFPPLGIQNVNSAPVPPVFNPEPFRKPNELHFTPTQLPPQNIQNILDPQFEVIKSHQIGDIKEITYPIDVTQSPMIDLTQPKGVNTNFIENNEVPILTEIGSYVTIPPTITGFPPTIQPTRYTPRPQSIPNLIYQSSPSPSTPAPEVIYQSSPFPINHKPLILVPVPTSTSVIPLEEVRNEIDNSPAASSYNISVTNHNTVDGIFEVDHGLEEHHLYLTTPPPKDDLLLNEIRKKPQRQNHKIFRGTPKDLLDSPIHYGLGGSSPRPFTKDPSLLSIRGTTPPPNIAFEPTPTSTFSAIDASGQYAGILPPNNFQSNKKPKNVQQIIIPYNTKVKPRPFEKAEGFVPQESKVIQATEPPTRKTTKYLTKILATNLREILRREQENKTVGIDLRNLQNKIDGWTEEEFTSVSHRASTVAIRGRSKSIPGEYLTTTPSLKDLEENYTNDPDPSESKKKEYFERTSKKYTYITRTKPVEDNRLDSEESSQPSSTFSNVRIVSETEPQPWTKTEVSVSPLTKEKVYVVTPQPLIQRAKPTVGDNVGTFKSPRFIERPTPASKRKSTYTPELFGLMDLSSFVPEDPVQTYSGHSKVVIIRPSNSQHFLKAFQKPVPSL
ncbi:hypothetical protein ACFFRR_002188 [Megaselia abdita]